MSTNLSSLITNSIPGAQGEKNYLATGASTSQGWTASGAGITVGTDTTGSNLPRPNTTLTGIKFTGVSGSTAYAYYRFILDDADVGKTLKVQFDMKPGTAVSSDFKVDVYSFTASDYSTGSARVSLSTDSSAVTAIPAATGTFKSSFSGPAITSKWIEVRIGLNASATHTLYVSDFIVGPGVVQQGSAVSPVALTATFTNGTGLTISDFLTYQRVGENLLINGYITWTGDGTSASGFTVSWPGLTPVQSQSGTVRVELKTTGYAYDYSAFVLSGALAFFNQNVGSVASTQVLGNSLGGTTSGRIQTMYFANVMVKISEWIGSGTVNIVQNDVMYAYNSGALTAANATDTTNYGYGPGGTPVLNYSGALGSAQYCGYRVTLPQPLSTTSKPTLEFSADRVTWVDAAALGLQLSVLTTNNSGSQLTAVDSTHIDVRFYAYATPAGGGTSWGSYTTFYWRIRVVNAGQAVGFANVSQYSSGLMPASNANLDDASATRLGLKQYLHGTTYNGAAPTVTLSSGGGTLSSVTRAVFVPYQMQDGTWRMRANATMSVSSAARTTGVFAINGVTFKNVGSFTQICTGASNNNAYAVAYAIANTGTVEIDHASATTIAYYFSGDFELDSKPTWAY